jgi:hypothetical protein
MPERTEQQKRELELLANIDDEDIDLSEMPEIADLTGFERGHSLRFFSAAVTACAV